MEEKHLIVGEIKKQEAEHKLLNAENLNKVRAIAIYGDCGSGKTALAYKCIEAMKPLNRQVYLVQHPKVELIEEFGWQNLSNIEEMEYLQDCIIYIDEPQLKISIYDKRANEVIAKMCSLARQRNIILIISSSDTRCFTKHNESFFDLWLVKDLDYEMVKQRSKIKKIVQANTFLDARGFRLKVNQFLSYSRALRKFNGLHTFDLSKNWTEKHSKPFAFDVELTPISSIYQSNEKLSDKLGD